jgi:hypothetical protein
MIITKLIENTLLQNIKKVVRYKNCLEGIKTNDFGRFVKNCHTINHNYYYRTYKIFYTIATGDIKQFIEGYTNNMKNIVSMGKKGGTPPVFKKRKKKKKQTSHHFDWLLQFVPSDIYVKNITEKGKITLMTYPNILKKASKIINECKKKVVWGQRVQTARICTCINKKVLHVSIVVIPKFPKKIYNNYLVEDYGRKTVSKIFANRFISYFDVFRDPVIGSCLNHLYLHIDKNAVTCSHFVKTVYITGEQDQKGKDDFISLSIFQEGLLLRLNEFMEKFVNKWLLSSKKKNLILEFKAIYFQVIYALYCADKWFGFRHNDLHLDNIMVTLLDIDSPGLVYKIFGKTYFIPSYITKYKIKIIDFDRAYIKDPLQKIKSIKHEKYRKIVGDMLKNMFSYTYDINGNIYYKMEDNLSKLRKRDLERMHWGAMGWFEGEHIKDDGIHDILSKIKFNKKILDDKIFKNMKNETFQKKTTFYKDLLKDSFFDNFLKLGSMLKKKKISEIPKEDRNFYIAKNEKMRKLIHAHPRFLLNIKKYCSK